MSNKEILTNLISMKYELDLAFYHIDRVKGKIKELDDYISSNLEDEPNEEVAEANELEEIIKEITDRLNNTYGSKISIVVKEVK